MHAGFKAAIVILVLGGALALIIFLGVWYSSRQSGSAFYDNIRSVGGLPKPPPRRPPVDLSRSQSTVTTRIGPTDVTSSNGTSRTNGQAVNRLNGTNGTNGQAVNRLNGTNGSQPMNGVNGQANAQTLNGVSGVSGVNGVNGVIGQANAQARNGVSDVNGAIGQANAQARSGLNGTSGSQPMNGTIGQAGQTSQTGQAFIAPSNITNVAQLPNRPVTQPVMQNVATNGGVSGAQPTQPNQSIQPTRANDLQSIYNPGGGAAANLPNVTDGGLEQGVYNPGGGAVANLPNPTDGGLEQGVYNPDGVTVNQRVSGRASVPWAWSSNQVISRY